MQFVTIRESHSDSFRPRVQWGGRRGHFFEVWYELSHDLASEGLTVDLAPDLGKWCPREFGPHILAGFREACHEAETGGSRLCATRIVVTFAKYHDVDTTP